MTNFISLTPLSKIVPEEYRQVLEVLGAFGPSVDFFDDVYYASLKSSTIGGEHLLTMQIMVIDEVVILFPWLQALGLVLRAADQDGLRMLDTSAKISIEVSESGEGLTVLDQSRIEITIGGIEVGLRFPRSWLAPLEQDSNSISPSGNVEFVVEGSIQAGWSNGTFAFGLTVDTAANLPRSMIGTSGWIVEVLSVQPRLSDKQQLPAAAASLGLLDDWRGIYIEEARVWPPDGLDNILPSELSLHNCAIGENGFIGALEINWDPASSVVMFGIQLNVQHLMMKIALSEVTEFDLRGDFSLPALLGNDGNPASIAFSVEEGATGYRILANAIPPLQLGGVDVEFVTLLIEFNATEVTDASGSGVLRIVGLEQTDGSQAEIDFTVGYDSGFYKLNTSLPSVKLGSFELVLDMINVSFNNAGSVSANIIGSLTFPGLKNTANGTDALIGFKLDMTGDAYTFKATQLPPLKLGDLGVQFTIFELSFGRNIPLDTEIAGEITIPGIKDTQGQIATLGFEWNTAGGQHMLITSNLPTLAVGGFELTLSDCDIAVSDAGLESFSAKGTFTIPGLENPPGTPAQIGFVLGLQDDIFRAAVSSVPTLNLGPLELSIDTVDLSFSEVGVHSAGLSGLLTVPGLETEDGDDAEIQFGLRADGDVFSISAQDLNELPPLKLGELSISLTSFDVTFGENVPISSSIAGYIEVPFFENSAGEPLCLDVTIDLDDGLGVSAKVPGGEVQILNIADVIRVTLCKLSFGYGARGVRFAIGGRIENRLSVPMLDALVPSEIKVNDLSYDPQTDKMDLNLEVTWPSGLIISQAGAGGFEVVVPVDEIGEGLSLYAVRFVFADKGDAYDFSIAFQGAVLNLGPLTGTVSGLGFVATVEPRSEGNGNLGPLQLDLGYLPVTGLGISIDTCGLGGGGLLLFDDTKKLYSGGLALNFGSIGLVAIGLITTRMPDGTDGFSMLISIATTFNPPIQLSYGFTLSGVGGLIGVNRTMSTEELRKGIKTGTINSIMFPEPSTVIANAAKIISDMQSVFPSEEGKYVIGPMLKIGWGSNIIVVDIGLFIEIGLAGNGIEVARVVLMGQAVMSLPTPETQVIGVNIDILGVLDLERKEMSFQAAINASSLMAFKMYGDCAFLVSWGDRPDMALAIGGFHPRFTPPSPQSVFANLRRMTLVVNYGPVIELGCTGYLALTPNSLQLGAQVHVFIGIKDLDIGIKGYIGFDTIFIFSPFSFEFSVCAGMTITAMGITLTDVSTQFTLSGPKPWNAYGKAVFKILFWDVDANFNITWGETRPEMRPLIDPLDKFRAALAAPGGWSTLPPHWTAVEYFASLKDSPLVVHPLSMLELRQNVLPLNIILEMFGNASITEHDQFEIKEVKSGNGSNLLRGFLKEYFARGQFQNLTNDQKLSIPSFEMFKAGFTTSSSIDVELGQGYLFCWDDIPGNDSNRLIEFLEQKFGISWVNTENIEKNIEKIEGGKAIKVSVGKNCLLLKLNDGQTKVNLKIDVDRSAELEAKSENGKLNIYEQVFERSIAEYDTPPLDNDPEREQEQYLFGWDNVEDTEKNPGYEKYILINYLKQKFRFKWLETAIIRKIPHNPNTIKIKGSFKWPPCPQNYILIKLNDSKTSASLSISTDNGTYKYISRLENNMLKIYTGFERGRSEWTAARVLTEEYARTKAYRRGNSFSYAIQDRFRTGRTPSHAVVNISQDGYRVVYASDLTTAILDKSIGSINKGLTKVGADQARLAQLALDPSRDLLVVSEHEIADYEEIA